MIQTVCVIHWQVHDKQIQDIKTKSAGGQLGKASYGN